MNRNPVWLGMALALIFSTGCTEQGRNVSGGKGDSVPAESNAAGNGGRDADAPRVIATFPANGAQDVDPATTEISVTFSKEMQDGSWSWAYKDPFKIPDMPADPYFTAGGTKNILPVRLKPDQEYELWINTEKFNFFRDKDGVPSVPYEFKFKTKGTATP